MAYHASQSTLVKLLKDKDGVYYLQYPAAVHELLKVERYIERWPLIPVKELYASSVQHPDKAEWCWLLHE